MTLRALFLADGPSDAPLGGYVEQLARQRGADLDVVAPDLRRLSPTPGLQVESRISAVFAFDDAFDLVIVHRDAEARTTTARVEEVRCGIAAVREGLPFIPVIPIKMTEAWLLLDEAAIRRVAGRPNSTESLGLPPRSKVEETPDPKAVLKRALEKASGTRGRRLRAFQRDFGTHRRLLLEGLDLNGPVATLTAWQELLRNIESALKQCQDSPQPSA